MPVEPAEFRHALGHFAAGVTVVTLEAGQERFGITVTSFCSLSLHPPLVLVCIDHRARIHDHLKLGATFAVNLLEQSQEQVSRAFARREPDPFTLVRTRAGKRQTPLIEGALSAIECAIVDLLPGGDHTIVVGRVDATTTGEGRPLVYQLARYGSFEPVSGD